MGIIVPCSCGHFVSVSEEYAGKQSECGFCGSVIFVPPPCQEPMPMPFVTPPHLITPGCPECFLAITDDEASVHADFPTQGILEAFVEGFAMKMREKFNVRCGMAPQAEAPNVFVRVIRIDEGSRFLRYMLPFIGVFIGGATTFEVDGHFLKPQGMKQKFHHKLRGYWGLFGGCSKALLARAGRSAGARTAKAFQKVWR